MGLPIIGDLIREAAGVVKELIPDADKRMEINLKLSELADKADERENALLLGQLEINKIEAQSENLFKSGWRPFIGWVCGSALAYTWILAPVLKWLFHINELPVIDPSQIYPVVMAMLGLAGARTYEKVKGVTAPIKPEETKEDKQEPQTKQKSSSWFR